MHITKMTIGGIPPFTEPVEFEFDQRVNLLIGPNASGKSTVLKALSPDRADDVRVKADDPQIQRLVAANWPVWPDGRINARAVPRIYLPPIRLGWPSENERQVLLANPPTRRNVKSVLAESTDIFDSKSVFEAIEILYERAQREPLLNSQLAQIAMLSYSCANAVCNEIFVGKSPMYYVDSMSRTDSRSNDTLPDELFRVPVVRYANAVTIVDKPDDPIFVGELSSGTQGIYLWVWYLSLRIADFYSFERGWETKPAILLIDEIENHLHPTWQRRVIPALLEHFPGLQIFATTPLPLCCRRPEGRAGASAEP